MYIQQIEIDNFKSFHGKTVIPFKTGFTTVSGPNGSGKSNIIDSILFCLGLSTSRTMRAEKLTDLINNLSSRREAQVTILFGTNESDDDLNKIVVSRKIKDSGKAGYASTYYLNGRVVTLSEIHDTLSQHNISPGSFNVLMQGDVTGIINMSATERRKIIDEIAGVAEFDRKIDQAQKELASVSASIERFSILMEELANRLAQLGEERNQALQYQALKDEKQRYEGQVLGAKLADLQKALKATDDNIVQARKNKQQAQENLKTLEATVQKTRQELTHIANEVKRKGEDQQIALKKQIEGLKGAIATKRNVIEFGVNKKKENHQSVENLNGEIINIENKIDDLRTAIEGVEQQSKEIQVLLDQEKAAYTQLEAKLMELTDSTGEMAAQRQQKREQLEGARDRFGALNRDKQDMEAELMRGQKELAFIQNQLSVHSSRFEELSIKKTDLEKKVADFQLEDQAFQSQINQLTLSVAKIRVDLKEKTAKYNGLQGDYNRLDAQKRAYEDLNFGRSVDTILNSGISGVHGTLAQLGRAVEPYGLALEIAMGARIKNIVVDDDRVAEDCIELLKQTRAGRATLLPMTKMRSPGYLGILPEDDRIVDYAINLIEFDSRYESVFAYALGDTVIVEDMATARKYIGKFRMVTLDGSLVEKTGAMTGGSSSQQGGGMLQSGKIEQELVQIRKQLDKASADRDQLEKQLTQSEIKLDALKGDYTQFVTSNQRHQVELEAIDREFAQMATQAESTPEVEAIEAQIQGLESDIAQADTQLTVIEAEIAGFAQELDEIDAKLPQAEIERFKTDMADIEFQIRSYESKLRNNENATQSSRMEKEFHQKSIASHKEQQDKLRAENQKIEKENLQYIEEIKLLDKQIDGLEAQTGELDEELKQLQAERDEVQERLIQEEQQKHNCIQNIDRIDEQVLSYQARKRELEPEITITREQMLEAGIDPETLNLDELPPADELLRRIVKIERKMEAMGAVNMRAIQEYDEVSSRNQELTDKVDTLKREQTDLDIKINGYSELKLNTFTTAFENVDNNFKEIFAELSDGEGKLVLTNPADPFSGGLTIEARPRGKKMLRIEAMSGGEKSLTALAFVFAIQRYMPAPFYAFDEVDMSLDGINAEKLSHMVRKQAQHNQTQFIVISHRKPMLQTSDRTVGVTQKRNGITKVTGVALRDEC